MKTCSKCGEVKEEGEFRLTKNRRGNNVLRAQCKQCEKLKDADYKNKNRDLINAKASEHQKNNRAKINIAKKKYYAKLKLEGKIKYAEKKPPVTEKICRKCKEKKGILFFVKKDAICKNCNYLLSIEWAKLNPEKIIASRKIQDIKTVSELRPYYLRKVAKNQGWPIDFIESNPQLLELIKLNLKATRYVKAENQKD